MPYAIRRRRRPSPLYAPRRRRRYVPAYLPTKSTVRARQNWAKARQVLTGVRLRNKRRRAAAYRAANTIYLTRGQLDAYLRGVEARLRAEGVARARREGYLPGRAAAPLLKDPAFLQEAYGDYRRSMPGRRLRAPGYGKSTGRRPKIGMRLWYPGKITRAKRLRRLRNQRWKQKLLREADRYGYADEDVADLLKAHASRRR